HTHHAGGRIGLGLHWARSPHQSQPAQRHSGTPQQGNRVHRVVSFRTRGWPTNAGPGRLEDINRRRPRPSRETECR
ncbi:MAG: hypothetical protein ACK56F_14885, partial [bacterium]